MGQQFIVYLCITDPELAYLIALEGACCLNMAVVIFTPALTWRSRIRIAVAGLVGQNMMMQGDAN